MASIVESTCITTPVVLSHHTRASDNEEVPEQLSRSVCEKKNTEMTTSSSSVESLPPIVASTAITPSSVLPHQTMATDNGDVSEQLCSVCETKISEMTTSSSSVEPLPPIDVSSCITPSLVLCLQNAEHCDE